MKPKIWISTTLLPLVAFVLLTRNHAFSKHRPLETAQSRGQNEHRTIVVDGILDPAVTVAIAAPAVEVNVPANSWVSKGQFIGESLLPIDPENANESDFVNPATSGGNTERVAAEAEAERATAGLAAAEEDDRIAEQDYARERELFREGLVGELEFDRIRDREQSAQASLAAAQARLREAENQVSNVEVGVFDGQGGLANAGSYRNELPPPVYGPVRRVPIASPADGLLLESKLHPGSYGIASDLTKLCGYARLSQKDLSDVRIGEFAEIRIGSLPTVTLDAHVTAIRPVDPEVPGGPEYVAILSVQNPGSAKFAGLPVRISLRGDLPPVPEPAAPTVSSDAGMPHAQ